jgi:hypothetical protein
MFIVYFSEGLIVGSLLGLLLRPVLEYWVLWHRAKAHERMDQSSIRVDLARPRGFDAPKPELNGHNGEVEHREIAKG